ncbi:MAG: CRTAC1 family protein [Acidobacteriota bacterium]|nr:MAG: CRTAC1 family protein [Acidobacteriota bacterium]
MFHSFKRVLRFRSPHLGRSALVSGWLGLGLFPTSLFAAPDELRFVDVTAESGIRFEHINGPRVEKKYLFEAKGGGLAFLDYDNDGWQDLLLAQGSTLEQFKNGQTLPCTLYRNLGNGRFEDVSQESGMTQGGWAMGIATGDYDNDGDVDIYVAELRANKLYRNDGNGTFTEVGAVAGVRSEEWSASAAFGDYDQDGDLDLYVSNYVALDLDHLIEPGAQSFCQYRGRPDLCGPMGLRAAPNVLYRNNGDGTFSDVTESSGVGESNYYYSLGVVWSDLDRDGDPDLLVANDSSANQLFLNEGAGKFSEIGFISGLAASGDGGFQASMGIDVADYDRDGKPDVFMTHFANDYSTLYNNRGDLLFEDVTSKAKLVQPEWLLVSWGTRFADFDLDGWLDIFHANGHVYPFLIDAGWSEEYEQPASLFLNQKDGTFADYSARAGEALTIRKVSRGVAFADYDNDGDIDIAIANLNDAPRLLRNESPKQNHWLMFRLAGHSSNRDGIGALITIRVGEEVQQWEMKRSVGIYSSSDPRAHFGLSRAAKADNVEVRWPSGKVQTFSDVRVDTHYVIDEEEGLSIEAFKAPQR